MITVDPGITPERMRILWNQAIREAELNPGQTVVISFSPGKYPLPHMGAYDYEDHTVVVVHRPIEMHFRANRSNGKVTISAAGQAA